MFDGENILFYVFGLPSEITTITIETTTNNCDQTESTISSAVSQYAGAANDYQYVPFFLLIN